MASRSRCNVSKYFYLLFLQVAVNWVDIMLLLTESAVHTQKYLLWRHAVRTERSEVRAAWRHNKYFQYGPNSRLIRALSYTHTSKTTKVSLLLWTEVQPVHTPVRTQGYGPDLRQSNFSILSVFCLVYNNDLYGVVVGVQYLMPIGQGRISSVMWTNSGQTQLGCKKHLYIIVDISWVRVRALEGTSRVYTSLVTKSVNELSRHRIIERNVIWVALPFQNTPQTWNLKSVMKGLITKFDLLKLTNVKDKALEMLL